MKPLHSIFLALAFSLDLTHPAASGAAIAPAASHPGDTMIANYFKAETVLLEERSLAEIQTLEDWTAKKAGYRQQLFEMLSLSPLPDRTDLKPVVTAKLEHDLFRVEKLHFQSLPGLYVTANLYLPKLPSKPAPAILYVCGHAKVAKDGVSFGNKAGYQHHGAWFARNGYVCLVIDTIQLGEIEGIHHGTYREGLWWWNARGYTPAGVEAWNSIRALDYLQSRPEVDGARLGVTGRSGGGAYSWWVAALDDRIKAAAPVAGITDLRNHVVDGVVEGHCDCMFTVNTYRWDYAQIAALVAPRPLLICNSDKDSIFPLDGVTRVHRQVRRIYELHRAGDKLGLLITEGPHKDTQDLQVPVFRWFNRHLKGEDPIIEMAATKFFDPEALRVFAKLPADERTSKIHETFVAPAPAPDVPPDARAWSEQRAAWEKALREKVFAGWPELSESFQLHRAFSAEAQGARLEAYDFTSQHDIRLRFYVLRALAPPKPSHLQLEIWDDRQWTEWLRSMEPAFAGSLGGELSAAGMVRGASDSAQNAATLQDRVNVMRRDRSILVGFAPRGIGLSAWDPSDRKRTQLRRRFMLLGQTLDSMRVWDIRRALQAIRSIPEYANTDISLTARKEMGVNALYAAIFEPGLASIELSGLAKSHQLGPDYLNILRVLDIPQAVAMAAQRSPVQLRDARADEWPYPAAVAAALRWNPGQFRIP